MSDIALTASVDFSKAEADVNKFVNETKKKLSDILAKANGAGGSFSSTNRGAKASGTAAGSTSSASSTDPYERMRRAFDGNIKFRRDSEREYTRWWGSELGEREKAARASARRMQDAFKSAQTIRRQSGSLGSFIDQQFGLDQASLNRTEQAAKAFRSRIERTLTAATGTATRRSVNTVDAISQITSGGTGQQAALAAYYNKMSEAAEKGARQLQDRALRASQNMGTVLRQKGNLANVLMDNVSSGTGQSQAIADYYNRQASAAIIAQEKARQQVETATKAAASREENARRSASRTSTVREIVQMRAMGAVSSRADTLTSRINTQLPDDSSAKKVLLDEVAKSASRANQAIAQYGAGSTQAASQTLTWGVEIRKISDRLREEVASLGSVEKARRSAAAAATAEAKAAETAAKAEQRQATRQVTATQSSNRASVLATGSARNTALGVSNRIDRQLGGDPSAQRTLYRELDKALSNYTNTIGQYGTRSLQGAKATVAWNSELTRIRGAIAEKGGLLRTLNANTNTLSSSINGLSGNFGGFRRMILNTQVALTALTAAFGGREIFQTAAQLESVQNTLKAVSPSAADAASNFEFLRKAGDAVGFSYLDAGRSFSQLTASMMAAGATTEQAQQTFLRLTIASRNLGLTSADTDGVIRAMTQSFSKGRFSAEEIRQQLGDRMPIAMAALEKATGKTGTQLDKLMKEGKITTSQYGGAFVEAMLEMSGGLNAAERASLGLMAATGRLQNAFTDLVQNNPEIQKGLSSFVRGLTNALKSDTAQAAIQIMAGAFTVLGAAMTQIVSIADQYLAPTMKSIGDFLQNNVTTSINIAAGALSGAMVTGLAAATTAMVAFTGAFLSNPLGLIATGVGIAVAAWLQYKDTVVEVAGQSAKVSDWLGAAATEFSTIWGEVFKSFREKFEELWPSIKEFATYVASIMADVGESIVDVVGGMVVGVAKGIDKVVTTIRAVPLVLDAMANDGAQIFTNLANNIVNIWRAAMGSLSILSEGFMTGIRTLATNVLSGNITGALSEAMKAVSDVVDRGMAETAARMKESSTFVSTLGPTINAAFGENGSTAAQDFVKNFVANLNAGAGSIQAAIANAATVSMNRIAADAANRTLYALDMSSAGASDAANVPAPRATPPSVRNLIAPLTGTGTRRSADDAKPDKNGQSLQNALKELMQDLRRQSASAGIDGAGAQAYATVLNKIKDAADNGKGAIASLAEQTEALRLVQEKLNKEMALYITQTNRASEGNEAVARAYMQSATAGEAAETRLKAQLKAMEYTPRYDERGRETDEYRKKVEELVPVIERETRSHKDLAAAKGISKNRDELELLQAEGKLLATNVNLREEELAALKARQENRGASDSVIAQAEQSARALVRQRNETEQLRNSMDELANLGEQAFDRIGSAITEAFANGKLKAIDFGSITKALFSEIVQAGLKLAVLNPLLNSLFGGNRGTLGGVITVMSGGSTGGSSDSQSFSAARVLSSLDNRSGAAAQAGTSSSGSGGLFSNFSNLGSLFSRNSSTGGIFGGGIFGNMGSGVAAASFDSFGGTASSMAGAMGAGGDAAFGMTNAIQATSLVNNGGLASMTGAVSGGGLNLSGAAIGQSAGGVAAGMGIGSMVGGMVAGAKNPAKQQNAQIGAAIGAIAGMYFGVVGSMVGGAIGGAIGGLFGPKGKFAGGVGQIAVNESGQFYYSGSTGKNYNENEVSQDVTSMTTALNKQLKASKLKVAHNPKSNTEFNDTWGTDYDLPDIVAYQGYGNATEKAEPELVKVIQARGTVENATVDKVMKASKATDLTTLFEDIQWGRDVYEPLSRTGIEASSFKVALDTSMKSFDDAIEKAHELGLAEDELKSKRQEAIDKAYRVRDRQVEDINLSTDAAIMQQEGTYGASDDLFRFDLNATRSLQDLRDQLVDLGIATRDNVIHTAEYAKTEKLLGLQREELAKQWVRTEEDKAYTKMQAKQSVSLSAMGYAGKTNTAELISYDTTSARSLVELRRSLEDLKLSAEEVSLTMDTAAENIAKGRERLLENQKLALADTNGSLKDRYDTAMGTYDDLSNQLIRLERQQAKERIELARQEGVDMAQLQITQAAERQALVKADAEKTRKTALDTGKTIRSFIDSLNTSSTAGRSPTDQFRYASLIFERDLSLTKAGDEDASGRITQTAQSLLEAASGMYGSSEEYAKILKYVESSLTQLPQTLSYDKQTLDVLLNTNALEVAQKLELSLIAQRAGGEAGAGIVKAAVDAGYGATIAALGGNFQNSWAVDQYLTTSQILNDNALTDKLAAAVTGAMIVLSNAERSEANAMGSATVIAIMGLQATMAALQGGVSVTADRTSYATNQLAETNLRAAEIRNAIYAVNTSVGNDVVNRLDMINSTLKDVIAGLSAVKSAISQIKVGFPVTTEPDVSTQQGGSGGAGFALGGAFHRGRVMPYALGGAFTSSIVSSPTYFPMSEGRTGLMGEAGPEAIMPLDRASDGSLGVRAIMPMPIAAPGNDNDAETAFEVRALRAEVAALRGALTSLGQQQVANQNRTAEAAERSADSLEDSAAIARRERLLQKLR